MKKKEPFDEKCRRLGLFDKSLEEIIDLIDEKNCEIEKLKGRQKCNCPRCGGFSLDVYEEEKNDTTI